jgi:hypothetical protein
MPRAASKSRVEDGIDASVTVAPTVSRVARQPWLVIASIPTPSIASAVKPRYYPASPACRLAGRSEDAASENLVSPLE